MNYELGIIYIATGKRYLAEAVHSANSAKKLMPDIPISLWIDRNTDKNVNINHNNCFDSINMIHDPKYSFLDKMRPLFETKYEKTLFVDTDTYFLDSIYEISTLLDQFEIACVHAPNRICSWEKNFKNHNVPICFPQLNTGVIAYRKNERVMQFFKEWERIYIKQLNQTPSPPHDQPAFREALYFSNLNLTILPPEYNLRADFPGYTGGSCHVKIIHGRDPYLSQAKSLANDTSHILFNFRELNNST